MKPPRSSRRLLWQMYPAFLSLTVLAVALGVWYVTAVLKEHQLQDHVVSLRARAALVVLQVEDQLRRGDLTGIQQLCRRAGERTDTRLTVMAAGGEVLGDSQEEPQRMENHAERPEMRAALAGEQGMTTRYSRTLQQQMMYLALPVAQDGQVVAVVRAAMAIDAIEERVTELRRRVVAGGLVISLLMALLCLWLSRRISRPLERIRREAQRYAEGALQQRLRVSGSSEIVDLAQTLNSMAHQLGERIATIEKQRHELEAVLSSMVEGVIAVDSQQNLLRINRAAARLLGVDAEAASGRNAAEVVRKAELLAALRQTLDRDSTLEKDVLLFSDGEELCLQLHGTQLRAQEGQVIGALLVLNDMTRLRRLETLRRDFVANVSHELKTPITAIKGFVETLQDGALDRREEAERFLQIIERQVERLSIIIEDLMSLSRIEQGEERHSFVLEVAPVAPVVAEAINDCVLQASQHDIRIERQCDGDWRVAINAPLLEQALTNLLDNAIKYSSTGGCIRVSCRAEQNELIIAVQDEGCGIEAEHLPRLFERFYRVDKARSRKAGGSGLGLAIVKHIVQIHRGQIQVSSLPGQGSTFSIRLPLA
ncbi:MAG: ATP-binding protein [Desulfuromonas sp.]|uniref:HAMP domain-containing sensor histidine kinase n=1 Tax=Desulfuromonas thiophila TaxID=57664 RepID=UPI0024A8F133|nr:ATP-binding protein [Desulfuromonas thiophila]